MEADFYSCISGSGTDIWLYASYNGHCYWTKNKKNALYAFGAISPKWNFLGKLTFLVPALIMTYYSVIGGWVTKYAVTYLSGKSSAAAEDSYFTDFITAPVAPIVFMLVFLAITAFVVYAYVDKGIERFSRLVMPGLLIMIICIAVFR